MKLSIEDATEEIFTKNIPIFLVDTCSFLDVISDFGPAPASIGQLSQEFAAFEIKYCNNFLWALSEANMLS